jgi:hypothetical protein
VEGVSLVLVESAHDNTINHDKLQWNVIQPKVQTIYQDATPQNMTQAKRQNIPPINNNYLHHPPDLLHKPPPGREPELHHHVCPVEGPGSPQLPTGLLAGLCGALTDSLGALQFESGRVVNE